MSLGSVRPAGVTDAGATGALHTTRRSRRLLAAALLSLVACATSQRPVPTASESTAAAGLRFVTIAAGLDYPVAITHAGDGSGRLFVAQQEGLIRIVRDDALVPQPFLDIRPLVRCCGEQGLLGVAFDPEYRDNGRLFVNYTNRRGDTVIARYRVSSDPDRADPAGALILLTIPQPTSIHNGGQLQFGPDGYLYIATGDGGSFGGDDGSGGDPQDRAQRTDELLGKILRIDVRAGDRYQIPPSNPFAADPRSRGEVWALGFKNPWRFSFDRATGDLFITDVGQSRWEEIDLQPAASRGGENYGWRRMEGPDCFSPAADCNTGGLVLPILAYGHDGNCAVIGGYRYRGARHPRLYGTYLYADFCSGRIWGATADAQGRWQSRLLRDTDYLITTFGEDEAGELYIADRRDGSVMRLGLEAE